MQILEIADKVEPGSVTQTDCISTQAWTRSNGDIELIGRFLGGGHRTLIVIPKSKRAALADFLAHAND